MAAVSATPSGTMAPPLPTALSWVNTRQPPRLDLLRGRVVLLHFWTYSSVNAQNALPDLRYLENKYHDGLSVLGIHVPRFPQERQDANVLKAVNRLYVRHPVANDPDFLAWQMYGARAWPTMVLIDPEGRLAGAWAGEGLRSDLDQRIGELLEEAAGRDARVYESSPPVSRPEPKLPLRFPGRVLVSESMLYVADSGHNRVLECTHDGRVLRQFGSGNPGFWDGRGTDAGFSFPQGLALIKDFLLVADLGNHSVRRIRLHTGEVDTIAGTGVQGRASVADSAEPSTVALNAPRDVCAAGERLFIACTGNHQVWQLDLARGRLGVFAGSGRYGLVDAAGGEAQFAQPSGLASHGQMLYVADADNSAIRAVRFLDLGVKTLAGVGPWDSGDADGLPAAVRLQYPTAIAVDPGGSILWVCDTYNNKVKALSLRGGGVRTLALPYRFHEPGGIAVAQGSLWIANTNAHEIVRIDTGSGVIKRLPVAE